MAHIILIEPDRVLADTYRAGFEASGHSVVMCAGAQAAVFAADEKTPDIIIMELQLIGHSGVEFLYEFRSYPEWQEIPVLVHTQVPSSEFSGSWKMLSSQLSVSGYLYKPTTTFRELQKSVHTALSPAFI